jgi:hypothetical protein
VESVHSLFHSSFLLFISTDLLYVFELILPFTNTYNYTEPLYGGACFIDAQITVTINNILNTLLPVIAIIVVNCAMLTKVILLKRRIASSKSTSVSNDRTLWKKNRRLVIQLMTIAFATSLSWLPFISCAIVYPFENTFISNSVLKLLNYFPYFNCLLTPFLAVVTFPKEIRDKPVLSIFCCRWRQRATTPPLAYSLNNIDQRRKTMDDVQIIAETALE